MLVKRGGASVYPYPAVELLAKFTCILPCPMALIYLLRKRDRQINVITELKKYQAIIIVYISVANKHICFHGMNPEMENLQRNRNKKLSVILAEIRCKKYILLEPWS